MSDNPDGMRNLSYWQKAKSSKKEMSGFVVGLHGREKGNKLVCADENADIWKQLRKKIKYFKKPEKHNVAIF